MFFDIKNRLNNFNVLPASFLLKTRKEPFMYGRTLLYRTVIIPTSIFYNVKFREEYQDILNTKFVCSGTIKLNGMILVEGEVSLDEKLKFNVNGRQLEVKTRIYPSDLSLMILAAIAINFSIYSVALYIKY